jgi:methyltransferase (TIGR00027 family)
MNPSKSSKTAAQMALSRALEARRPAAERICSDPFAERLLGARHRMLLAARPLRAWIERLIEALFPGHHHYVLVRTRAIDDFLDEQLTGEVRQLVILGAGYDSRAYRFADRLRDVAVFEVDHPATSQAKRANIERILGAIPAHVTYVPVDFNRESLGDQLALAGYRIDRRTIFLWEGTTPYLLAEAVDDTLRFLASNSGPGSVVIFDYILASVLDGSCDLRGARSEHDKMKTTSEPFVFGVKEGEIGAFLEARGFRDVRELGPDDLRARYLRGDRRERYMKPWWRIVRASVA